MELSPSLTFPLILFLLLICKMSWADDISDKQHSTSLQNEDYETQNTKFKGEEKRASVGTRDLIRMFLMAFHNNYPDGVHYGRYGGIPFRPVRRIGSEFLGKRSGDGVQANQENEDDEEFSKTLMKRARVRMGSEFLGKRRLGSEFLGKRNSDIVDFNDNFINDSEEPDLDLPMPLKSSSSWARSHPISSATFLPRTFEKRALGSEFLGKRRPYDWTWKRARLGSEFLGKRALGSEFLGKRSITQNDAEVPYHN